MNDYMRLYVGDKPEEYVHNKCFPPSFRMVIIGDSGAGKTCLLMRLLLEEGLLNYNKLHIFAKSLYQPQYKILKAGFDNNLSKEQIIILLNTQREQEKEGEEIEDFAEKIASLTKDKEKSDITCDFYENFSDVPDPTELDMSVRNLMIFDDIMTDNKSLRIAANYFTRSRSANCDCIFLAQSYKLLPLQEIRTNANFMIFFKSGSNVIRQLNQIYTNFDMEINELKKICQDAWKEKYKFLVIDRTREYESGNKYRKTLELNKS